VWLERWLMIVGVVCLGYFAYHTVAAWHFQRQQMAAFEARLASHAGRPHGAPQKQEPGVGSRASSAPVLASRDGRPPDRARPATPTPAARDDRAARGAASVTAPIARASVSRDNVLALLTIPRLGISTAVLSGDDQATLDLAAGHLPDTPKPWEAGNSAVAAHRDGLFRPLRKVRVGDEVRVQTEHGDFSYRVRETKIVSPDDLSVLAPQGGNTLTLITCYPFSFVGHAPKRFIVHADRVDAPVATQ
jgi:LPXTG-site transpeptidase (sortase) family protein